MADATITPPAPDATDRDVAKRYLYALDTTEQAMREARGEDAHLDV
jgi:hypothetical protein